MKPQTLSVAVLAIGAVPALAANDDALTRILIPSAVCRQMCNPCAWSIEVPRAAAAL